MSVLVVHEAIGADARPDESDALVQVEQVSAAMKKLGWRVSVLPTGLDLQSTIAAIRMHDAGCVFNLVEALGGDGRLIHLLPAALGVAKIAYTGSDADAIYTSSQKLLAKSLMQLHAIPTPSYFTRSDVCNDSDSIWIVKSVWEHASFGMDDGCVVKGTEAAHARMAESEAAHGGEWFAEKFVDGREFNISVLEQDGQPYILPVAEMTFVDYPKGKPRIVGYAAKWDESAPEYSATRRVFPTLADGERNRLKSIVEQCWKVFGLRGYARIDLRLDSHGDPWVLEINANPCLSQDAGFAAAALEAGIRFEKLIERVVLAARRPALLSYRRTG
ncbi:MAG: ATP-grasp domain-containing protein [Gammaproteobacteria bacterium]|nr:ATP-grasp domain-containing protein [Gammaproteobacteria bacterium]MDH4314694.1 ATP-grasp domain-containing protein [Gammaproteobacteria bacterium]MDH5214976.1 ATP-grasp domain-containing protein [Gammaproteobacteria bacterium]